MWSLLQSSRCFCLSLNSTRNEVSFWHSWCVFYWNSRSSCINISALNLISTCQVSSVRLPPHSSSMFREKELGGEGWSVPYCIYQYGKWFLAVLEVIGLTMYTSECVCIINVCAVHVMSRNFWSHRHWMKANNCSAVIFRANLCSSVICGGVGPTGQGKFRDSLYIYSSTINLLAYQTKKAFGISM